MSSRALRAYRAAMFVAQRLPRPVVYRGAALAGRVAPHLLRDEARTVEQHLRRVHTEQLTPEQLATGVSETFAFYARYWADSFRLPAMSRAELDGYFTHEGYEHIKEARRQGVGPIIALPHLGGWERAAYWMTMIEGVPVSAVVERLEPADLFAWFVDFRESLGMEVIALGPDAAKRVTRALRNNRVTCLLSDRDIGGTGIDVDFFGDRTKLPGGPATLALRTGAPILPTAVYFRGDKTHTVVKAPLPVERRGKLRDDVTRITQDLAYELEKLIRAAPEQWHVLQPVWPSDDLL